MRLALLDVGSTAARLELVDLDSSRIPSVDWSFKVRTRLAEHTAADGTVSAAGIEHAADAVRACVHAVGDRLPRSVVAFGTSAVRDAANGRQLRERLSAAAGIPIGVLSPHLEASLTYHAARRWHGVADSVLTTVDIGGGTVDVASGVGPYPGEVVSLPIGAARMTHVYLPDDPPHPEQTEELAAAVRETAEKALRGFAGNDLGHVLALSKVLRQLAVLAGSRGGRKARHPDRLLLGSLRKWIPRLSVLDQEQRAKLPGVSRSRARRILAGAILAEAIMETMDVDALEICPWGLREGIVFRFVEVRRRGAAVHGAVEEMFA